LKFSTFQPLSCDSTQVSASASQSLDFSSVVHELESTQSEDYCDLVYLIKDNKEFTKIPFTSRPTYILNLERNYNIEMRLRSPCNILVVIMHQFVGTTEGMFSN